MSDYTGSSTPIDIRNLWQTPPEIAAALHEEFNFVLDVAASDQNHLYPDYFTETHASGWSARCCLSSWTSQYRAGSIKTQCGAEDELQRNDRF